MFCYRLPMTKRQLKIVMLSGNPGPKFIKHFSCFTQMSRKFILLMNVKMPTIVVILTFISMINTISERLKVRNFFFIFSVCKFLRAVGILCSVENEKK